MGPNAQCNYHAHPSPCMLLKTLHFFLAASRKDMRNPTTVIKNVMRHICDGEAGGLGRNLRKVRAE